MTAPTATPPTGPPAGPHPGAPGDDRPPARSGFRRWFLVAAVSLGVVVLVLALVGLGAEDAKNGRVGQARCARDRLVLLVAQSVPTAQTVPCFQTFVDGWAVTTNQVDDTGTRLQLSTSEIDGATWSVQFAATCSPDPSAQTVESNDSGGPAGVQVRQVTSETDSSYSETDWYVFAGGCVTSQVQVPFRLDRNVVFQDIDDMLRLVPRSDLNDAVYADTDGELHLDPPSSTTSTVR
ncbi:MAG: hypothetical protein U0Q07_03650 [Acidimicrobiales bacterium]